MLLVGSLFYAGGEDSLTCCDLRWQWPGWSSGSHGDGGAGLGHLGFPDAALPTWEDELGWDRPCLGRRWMARAERGGWGSRVISFSCLRSPGQCL